MNDSELLEKANNLHRLAERVDSPFVPKPANDAIVTAAGILVELVKREVKRNAKGER